MEKLGNLFLVDLRTDNAESSCSAGTASSYIRNARNVVEVYPFAFSGSNDTLCTEDSTELLLIRKSVESVSDLCFCIFSCSFSAPACEDIICMVVVMMLVVMVVIVTAAGAVLVMFMVMMFMLVVIIIVIVVVVMLMLVIVIIVVVFMLVIVVIMIVVVMMFVFFLKEMLEFIVKGVLLSHCINELLTCELIPFCSYDRSSRIELTDKLYALVDLFLRKTGSMAENDAACVCYLVVEEFTEILLIHLALLCVYNCCESVEDYIVCIDVLYSTDNVAEFSYTGRLDEDTVGVILFKHLFESLAEITYKTAAYTAGVHLSDLNACVLEESAVYTDLTEFIFDEDEFFVVIAFFYELFDKGGLSCTEEA